MSETKCMVCGNVYDSGKCPRCNFLRMTVVGDYEEGLAKLARAAQIYRRDYLADIQIGIAVSKWKEHDGQLELDRTEILPLAKGEELLDGEKWCEEYFARIPDKEILEMLLIIQKADVQSNITVCLPNLMQAEIQQIGISLSDNMEICLMLRNHTALAASEPVSLFECG